MAGPLLRRAEAADAPIVARFDWLASLPPDGTSFWSRVAGETCDPLDFLTAARLEDAITWGRLTEFTLLEDAGGRVLAGAVGFLPRRPDARPLDLARLPAVARRLGWDAAALAECRRRYLADWGASAALDRSLGWHAPFMIESVAVLPEAQGQGHGRRLMQGLLAEAAAGGHDRVGLSVLLGNDPALALYRSLGFLPFVTFHEAYFGDGFPGLMQMIRVLEA